VTKLELKKSKIADDFTPKTMDNIATSPGSTSNVINSNMEENNNIVEKVNTPIGVSRSIESDINGELLDSTM